MLIFYPIVLIFIFLILPGFKVIQQYQKGVVFRFGKITGLKEPGLTWIIPYIEWVKKVDLRTVTMPIPPQRIITKDNVSVDISAVAYYQVVDSVKSIVAIENVMSAIN